MKFRRLVAAGGFLRRSPCGERGLKFRRLDAAGGFLRVAPRAGSVG